MTNSAELLVVGLGAVGSATAYQAAKAGARVIGIDRFSPPHDQGSSHGETRITRQAIGEGAEFVPLVLRSNEIWEQLEAETGRDLMTRNGALVIAGRDMAGEHHGSTSFLGDTIAAARQYGIAHEVLNAEDLRWRFPHFRVSPDEMAYYEPGAGFLRPEACVETQLALAARLGARLLMKERVTAVRPRADGVEVITDKGTYVAGKVVVTAGPWISKLAATEFQQHFKVYRQVLHWFDIARKAEQYTPSRFPVFIWITGSGAHDMMYGFPAIDGAGGGMKVATERYEAEVDPDAVVREVPAHEVEEMYARYIGPRLPDVSPRCLRSSTCLYTVTPDARFAIGHAMGSERVWFASACSGHGFKHSAALGEALADVSLGRTPKVELAPFRLERLTKKNPIA